MLRAATGSGEGAAREVASAGSVEGPAHGGRRGLAGRTRSRGARRHTAGEHPAPPDRGRAHRGRARQRWEAERWFLAADGESGKRYGTRPSASRRTVRSVSSCLPRWRNSPTPGTAGTSSPPESPSRTGLRVGRPSGGQPGHRLPHPPGCRAGPPAAICLPAVRARPGDPAGSGPRARCDRGGHHRRPPAWRLDHHGNPVGSPRRFFYDLTCNADHRDAQVAETAPSRLLNWARTCGVKAIAVEDLDFTAEKTREKHGRKKRFRQLLSGMPTGKLRARLTDGRRDRHCGHRRRSRLHIQAGSPTLQRPTTSTSRKTSRHDAASIAIGRRAQGHPSATMTPPHDDQSDRRGHRTVQALTGRPQA